MARTPQTQAKRARELALKEKRERKEAKKAARRAGLDISPDAENEDGFAVAEDQAETETDVVPEASAHPPNE
jgi:hypothetical protein